MKEKKRKEGKSAVFAIGASAFRRPLAEWTEANENWGKKFLCWGKKKFRDVIRRNEGCQMRRFFLTKYLKLDKDVKMRYCSNGDSFKSPIHWWLKRLKGARSFRQRVIFANEVLSINNFSVAFIRQWVISSNQNLMSSYFPMLVLPNAHFINLSFC
jgi:hypothetical protein